MKKSKLIKEMECYEYNKEFNIDIVEEDDSYGAWLYRNDYGFKTFMFGVPIESGSKEDFIEMVIANIDEYILFYDDELEILESSEK